MDEDQELSPELVTYYRDVLLKHANDLITDVCPVCQVAKCSDWVNAYTKLTVGGGLQWQDRIRPWGTADGEQ